MYQFAGPHRTNPPGWALAVGSVLQLGIIAAGLVVPAMYALGAVFAALWAVAIWLGLRYREAPRP
jgi:hypothetical protein